MSTLQNLSDRNYRLCISFFGYLAIEQDGQPLIPIPGQKVAALLTYLACNPHTHSRRQLAEIFWATAPPHRRLPNLRSTLNRLPTTFKRHLRTTAETITFAPADAIWIDVLAFQAVATCLPTTREQTSPESIANLLQIADQLQTMVHLYKGAFLEGPTIDDEPAFTEWLLMQRAHLESLAVAALRHLVYLFLQQGHYRAGIVHAERLIALDPLDEEARRRLMQLLAYSGQEQAAQQVYHALVAMVEEEFGAPPAPETVALYEHIVARQTRDPIKTAALPSFAQPPIGRATELATLLHLLQQPAGRLVTITGLGGMGKTYLAVEAARRLEARRDYLDGVVYVALAASSAATGFPDTLRQALGLIPTEQADLSAQICAYLADKELLLVFDNFEHLLAQPTPPPSQSAGTASARQLVLQILQAAPQVNLLITSRQPLALAPEQIFPLNGLSLAPVPPVVPNPVSDVDANLDPDKFPHVDHTQNDALQLFQQVALRSNHAFALTPENQAAVYRFCQLVQGMPLAIVLGAALMDFLSPQELVEECQEGLELLAATWRDLPERQQSMQVIFDYSWQQLDGSLQRLFANLSIFHGGFTQEAARQIADASPAQLNRLISYSLLVQTGPARYEMHALLHHYAAEKLADMTSSQPEPARLHTRYMQFYLRWIGRQTAALKGRQPFAAAAAIHPDLHNLRQAWAYGVQQQAVAELAQAIKGLEVYYDFQGLYQEGIALFGDAIQALQPFIKGNHGPAQPPAATGTPPPFLETYCLLINSRSFFFNRLGEIDQAIQLAKAAIRYTEQLPPNQPNRLSIQAEAYWIWGESLLWRDDFGAAKAKAAQALALAKQAADPTLMAWSLHLRAGAYFYEDQFTQALADVEQAYAISIQLGYLQNQVNHLDLLGQIKFITGELLAAKGYLEKAVQLSINLQDEQSKYINYVTLCRIALKLGEYRATEEYTLQALRFFRKHGNQREASYFYHNLGKLYNKMGRYEEASVQLTQGAQIAHRSGIHSEQARILLEQSIAVNGLGDKEHALALLAMADEIACTLGIDDLYGDVLMRRADLWLQLGRLDKSIALYQHALATYPPTLEYFRGDAMAGLAYALQQQGDAAAAMHYVQALLSYLAVDAERIHLLQNPFAAYLHCYHVLQAQQDPHAQAILLDAHTLLQQHAAQIDDAAQRRTFLEQVAVHREIVQIYAAVGHR